MVAEAVAMHVAWHEEPAVIAVESAVPQHTLLPVQSVLSTHSKVADIGPQAVAFGVQVPTPRELMQQLLVVSGQDVDPQSGTPASSYWTFVGTRPLLPPLLLLLDDVAPESCPPLLLPELELEPELDPLDPEDELEPEEEEVDPPSSSSKPLELLLQAGSAAMTKAPERANAPHTREVAEAGAMRTRRNCMIILREALHTTPSGRRWEEPGGREASSPGLLVDSWPP
jgi:hypothetical protein